jgi:glycogenin glucosyltransferase
MEDLAQPETLSWVRDRLDWPDMQYLTMRWSGRWTNIDLRFSGFSGYPGLSVLFGTHYAGTKPWNFNQEKALERFVRFEDFQFWYRMYIEMTHEYPGLKKNRRLVKVLRNVQRLLSST